jgi:hypothetical protein
MKAAAFALFQLAVMAALIAADAWWASLLYVFLMLATGNMVLEAVTQRYPASRVGAWWARQKAAAASRRNRAGRFQRAPQAFLIWFANLIVLK